MSQITTKNLHHRDANLNPTAINRRQFGLLATAGILGAAACSRPAPEAVAPPGSLSNIGIQLYTIRDTVEPDPLGAMKAVRAAGYAEVEFGGGGYFARQPSELQSYLDEAGLKAPGMHIGPAELADRMDDVIAMATGIGAQYVVLPWVPNEMRASTESWMAVADLCTRSAQRLSDHGIQFAYHNHEFEFFPLADGKSGYDVLTENTDPGLVHLEVDLFWAVKAGQDLGKLIDQHAGRISLCHVKDLDENGVMCLPGEGVIDFPSVFAQAKKAGLKHFFVEHDGLRTVDSRRLERAHRHLSGMNLS